jgi:hypothetical protein
MTSEGGTWMTWPETARRQAKNPEVDCPSRSTHSFVRRMDRRCGRVSIRNTTCSHGPVRPKGRVRGGAVFLHAKEA